jgi:hypothetical protein
VNIKSLWDLHNDVLIGKAPPVHIVAIFDKVLEELERRMPKPKKIPESPNQLMLFPEAKP